MENKEDWKELEQWEQKRKQIEQEKYGVPLEEIKNKKAKVSFIQTTRNVKDMPFLKWILGIVVVIVAVLFLLNRIYSGLNPNPEKDLVKSLSQNYNMEVMMVSKVEKEITEYIMAPKENLEITFKAIRNSATSYQDDYTDQSQKYFFEKWDSPNKNIFQIEDSIKEGFLEYSMYIEIKQYTQLEKAVKEISNFISYTGKWYQPSWMIYLKVQDNRIVTDYHSGMSAEDRENEYKRRYVNYVMKNSLEQEIPEQMLERYWRPDHLTVILNGEKLESKDIFGYYMSYFDGAYFLPLDNIFLEKIPELTMGKSKTFTYKEKTYTITSNTNLNKNELAYNATKEDVENVFQANIQMDYQQEQVIIQIE